MSLEDVILLIQTWIVENGNEEITADVLRPILEAMVNQPNDLIGDLDDLDTTYNTDLVGAINEVKTIAEGNSGVVIHYGSDTPFNTPPLAFAISDFYAQIVSSSVTSFWQYNGITWVEIKPLKVKTVFRFVSLVGITVEGKSQVQWAKEAINAAISANGNFTCNVGEVMTFFFNVASFTTSGGGAPLVKRIYFRLCTGDNVCSGITNSFTELMPDGNDLIEIEGDLVIDLGDIGTDNVWDAFNADPSQPFDMTDEKFVQGIQGGEPKLWQWRGGTGSFGNSGTIAVEDDFLDLTLQPDLPIEGEIYNPYATIALMLADQAGQTDQQIIKVVDASGDTNITFGVGETNLQAYYEYNGVANGLITDYTLISAPYSQPFGQPKVTINTGSEVTLYPFGNYCNGFLPNLTKAFTWLATNEVFPTGETAQVLIKTETGDSDFPTLADAEYVEGADFEEETYYDLYIYRLPATVCYTFLKRANYTPYVWTIIPDVIGSTEANTPPFSYDNPSAWKAQVPSIYTFRKGEFDVIGTYGAGQSIWFGSLTLEDYPEITKYSLSFILSDLPASWGMALYPLGNDGETGTNADYRINLSNTSSRLYQPYSTLRDTVSAAVEGDKIEILVETGKVSLFINDVLVADHSDVSITFSKLISSFAGTANGVKVTEIKQKMYIE